MGAKVPSILYAVNIATFLPRLPMLEPHGDILTDSELFPRQHEN